MTLYSHDKTIFFFRAKIIFLIIFKKKSSKKKFLPIFRRGNLKSSEPYLRIDNEYEKKYDYTREKDYGALNNSKIKHKSIDITQN